MPRSKITAKFQTTVPKEVRERLGISHSDELRWEIRGGEARVTLSSPAFLARRGCIEAGPTPGDALKIMRTRRGTR